MSISVDAVRNLIEDFKVQGQLSPTTTQKTVRLRVHQKVGIILTSEDLLYAWDTRSHTNGDIIYLNGHWELPPPLAHLMQRSDNVHECAHVRYSDFTVLGLIKVINTTNPNKAIILQNLLNIAEDSRVEAAVVTEFPGYLYLFILGHNVFMATQKDAADPPNAISELMNTYLSKVVYGEETQSWHFDITREVYEQTIYIMEKASRASTTMKAFELILEEVWPIIEKKMRLDQPVEYSPFSGEMSESDNPSKGRETRIVKTLPQQKKQLLDEMKEQKKRQKREQKKRQEEAKKKQEEAKKSQKKGKSDSKDDDGDDDSSGGDGASDDSDDEDQDLSDHEGDAECTDSKDDTDDGSEENKGESKKGPKTKEDKESKDDPEDDSDCNGEGDGRGDGNGDDDSSDDDSGSDGNPDDEGFDSSDDNSDDEGSGKGKSDDSDDDGPSGDGSGDEGVEGDDSDDDGDDDDGGGKGQDDGEDSEFGGDGGSDPKDDADGQGNSGDDSSDDSDTVDGQGGDSDDDSGDSGNSGDGSDGQGDSEDGSEDSDDGQPGSGKEDGDSNDDSNDDPEGDGNGQNDSGDSGQGDSDDDSQGQGDTEGQSGDGQGDDSISDDDSSGEDSIDGSGTAEDQSSENKGTDSQDVGNDDSDPLGYDGNIENTDDTITSTDEEDDEDHSPREVEDDREEDVEDDEMLKDLFEEMTRTFEEDQKKEEDEVVKEEEKQEEIEAIQNDLRLSVSDEMTPPQIEDIVDDDGKEIHYVKKHYVIRNNVPHDARFQMVKREVEHDVDGTVAQLETLIQSKQQATNRPRRKQKRGKISSTDITRLLQWDFRVHEQQQRGEDLSMAVSLVEDRSSSMGKYGERGKSTQGCHAKILLSEIMDRLGIPFEVIQFSGNMRGDKKAVDIWVPKPFDVPYYLVKEYVADCPKGNFTALGEAIDFAMYRLKEQPVKLHLLFVITDGDPLGNDIMNSKATMKLVMDKWSEELIVGVGIDGARVDKYFKDHIHIKDIFDLCPQMLELLRDTVISQFITG
jgi:hypothetical protein